MSPQSSQSPQSPQTHRCSNPLRSEFAEDQSMAELVAFFVDAMVDRTRDLQAAHDAGDLERLCRLAHQLKGAASGYGFPAITEKAAQLEASLRAESAAGQAEAVAWAASELIGLCASVRL